MKRHTFLKLVSFLVLLLLLSAGAGYVYRGYLCEPVTDSSAVRKVTLTVPSGMTIAKVASYLSEQQLIHNKYFFYYGAKYPVLVKGRETSGPLVLKSGVYDLSSDMTLAQIYAVLSSGISGQVHVTIPEGLTLRKVAQLLEEQKICSAQDFIAKGHDVQLLAEYHIPAESFEGYLFPDTYYLIPGMDSSDVLTKMADNFFAHIQSIPGLSEAPADVLHTKVILASIVEREYRIAEEAPLIASVFTNRINKEIGLYSCATIEYIITEIQGKEHPDVITYDDLQIDNPYNTYKWRGLPPGPISNPGTVALAAAANPPETNYYFFRVVDAAAGKHVFNSNFQSHVNSGNTLYTKKAAGSK